MCNRSRDRDQEWMNKVLGPEIFFFLESGAGERKSLDPPVGDRGQIAQLLVSYNLSDTP